MYRAAIVANASLPQHTIAYWQYSDDLQAMIYRAVVAMDLSPSKRSRLTNAGDHPSLKGACMGVTWNSKRQIYCAVPHPNTQLFLGLVTQHISQLYPSLQSATLAVKDCIRAKLHCDDNNIADSLAISLGPFSGGFLWQMTPDGGQPLCHGVWHPTDGTWQHLTTPHCGRRVSLVAFTHEAATKPVARTALDQARALGIGAPDTFRARDVIPSHPDKSYPATIVRYTNLCEHLADAASFTPLQLRRAHTARTTRLNTLLVLFLLAATGDTGDTTTLTHQGHDAYHAPPHIPFINAAYPQTSASVATLEHLKARNTVKHMTSQPAHDEAKHLTYKVQMHSSS